MTSCSLRRNERYVYLCLGEEDGQARGPRRCGPDASEGSPQHLPLPHACCARADVHRYRVPEVRAEKLGLRIRVDAHATGDSLEGVRYMPVSALQFMIAEASEGLLCEWRERQAR